MRINRLMVVLAGFGAIVALGLTAVPWTLGAGSSEAQEGAMYNCPQAGKWAISVWDGADGTDTGQALAACGQEAVDVAYYIDPDTQQWLRYFAGHAEISTLPMLNDKQGIIVRGSTPVTPGALAIPGATYTGTTSQGLLIEFQVSADGLTITEVTYRASGTKPEGGTCESLSSSTLGPSTVGTSIVDNSFSIAYAQFDMSGHFETQRQATGELTVHELQADNVPPCDAGPLTWTATIPSPTPTAVPPAPGEMHNCPKAGKWSIATWSGADGMPIDHALAFCPQQVEAAYYIDPQTQGWSRWFAGQPGMSTLSTLDNMQGVLALGAVGGGPATPTPSAAVAPSPTPAPTPTPHG